VNNYYVASPFNYNTFVGMAEDSKKLVALQSISPVVTFIFGFGGALLAMCVKRRQLVTSLLNLAAAGVLVAAGAVDLLSDGREILASVLSEIDGYPLHQLIAFSALLVLLITQAALKHHIAKKHTVHRSLTTEQIPMYENDGGPNKGNFDDTEEMVAQQMAAGSLTSAAILTVGLGFHSFVAGLALGAQTEMSHILNILGPILAHKALAAMALASSLIRARATNPVFYTVITLFSLTTPIGITVGTVVQSVTHEVVWEGVCLCLAAGTFFYIGIVEIIPESLEYGTSNLRFSAQILSLVAGFGLMAALNVWV
jgi:zinc transporter 1/2/3